MRKNLAKALGPLFAALITLVVGPQFAHAQGASPTQKQEVAAKLEQMSSELQLTPAQKKQMMPILMEEAPKLKSIKTDTSLGPFQKAMQLKQVGEETDAKFKPILTPEQYQKFQQIRAQEREQMAQKMKTGQM